MNYFLPFTKILLFCVVVFLCSLSLPCRGKDTLTLGESLQDGDTLISKGDIFELGFFTPGEPNRRYIGVWYRSFSTKLETILWVANREKPVTNLSGGALALSPDGNLIVTNTGSDVLWSTNISTPISNNQSRIVQLLADGNIVMNNSDGTTVWQSFDYPTDTYIPGMRVGLDLQTGVNQVFTSWRSKTDPAPGNFTLGIDPGRSTQLFVWDGRRPRWRSGRWNGQIFIGIEKMIPTYMYNFKLSNYDLEGKMYYYTGFNVSHRYMISWDGTDQHLIWSETIRSWTRFFAEPTTPCELYNRCGNYATCTEIDGKAGLEPSCTCLKGHIPAKETEWNNGNWTSGCVRRVPYKCEKEGNNGTDGFWRMQRVKLPDSSELDPDVMDEAGCQASCLNNCSCKAYSYVSGIGCLVWGVHLVDMHIFTHGGNDMYLRLASIELGQGKKKSAVVIIVAVLVSSFALLACTYLLWRCLKRKKGFVRWIKEQGEGSSNAKRRKDVTTEMSGVLKITDEGQVLRELPVFSFDAIITATDNFSYNNLLGEGGFGPVYKGVLPEGQEVAVKRLSQSSGQGMEEFKNEVILIAKLQHRNLVRLLGCCLQDEEKILIYELMPNGSLDTFLFDDEKKRQLDWRTRYKIIEGIARGLLYLHRDSRLRVIHRDLKVSNILLDEEMDPKISDFGLARIFGKDDNELNNTKRVVGTYGYMAPEYAMQGIFSVKSDVYSFGVLLLEIISGKKISTYYNHEFSLYLLGYAWKLWYENNLIELVEPAIRETCSIAEVVTCVTVALLCVQDHVNDRPTMSTVLIMLESGTAASMSPRQPSFAAIRGPTNTDSSTFELANASITVFTGR
ncbi:Serine/threonine-protein kinase [Rhynchospora pubera]|uniref:Receptor-like serine/threonine-protein kinase n=1 Tax=Rhynchospora pubera TaxID=906938 RepID=A0AAV8E4N0_9POAL|nr:Serine/threonine-protein kinase [Rhynchospora pubera]